MSVIEFYKCNNPKCDFETELQTSSPIWRDDTPEELRKVPISINAKQYVIGSKNQKFCTKCNDRLYIKENENTCANCHQENTFLNEGGQCPKCHNGIVVHDWRNDAVF